MIQVDIRNRTKKSDSDPQCCQKSDSESTQKPSTLCNSDSAALVV